MSKDPNTNGQWRLVELEPITHVLKENFNSIAVRFLIEVISSGNGFGIQMRSGNGSKKKRKKNGGDQF